jgi:tripartite motif-containing protein 71
MRKLTTIILSLFMFLVILFAISISAYSQDTYQFILKWGSHGTGDGQFKRPRGIAVDSSGYVYVADKNNHRIKKYDSSGTYLGSVKFSV